MKLSATFKPPKAYKPTMADKFRDLSPSSLGLLTTLLALDPAARGTAAQALQSNFFSAPPLPCDLSALPVVYKEDVEDPAASHDGRKPKLRQRSQKRKDSRQKAEQQQSDEVLKINIGSPDRQEEKVITESAKSGHESDGTVISAGANASSSSVQEPSENNVVNASSSRVTKRFSVSPVQVLLPQDQQLLRRANSHQHSDSDDDHENHQPFLAPDDDQADGEPSESGGDVIVNHSLESRPAASMSDFDAAAAALHVSGELPAKQYVLVDHV